MSYFSRIQLDAGHPHAREALHAVQVRDAYREHQWLWRFFPSAEGAPRDFLFRRIDPQGDRQHPMYYVVSARSPVVPHPAWRVDTCDYDPKLRDGERLAFDLRVNPVITRDGKRHDVVMDGKTALARNAGLDSWKALEPDRRPGEVRQTYAFIHKQVLAWLEGRDDRTGFAARNGFTIAHGDEDRPRLRVDGYRRHHLADKDKERKAAWFTSVDLNGELVVTDVGAFHKTLLHGLGHARAFGCGLLLVRRL